MLFLFHFNTQFPQKQSSTNSTGFGCLSAEVNVTKQSAYNISFWWKALLDSEVIWILKIIFRILSLLFKPCVVTPWIVWQTGSRNMTLIFYFFTWFRAFSDFFPLYYSSGSIGKCLTEETESGKPLYQPTILLPLCPTAKLSVIPNTVLIS